MNLSFSFRLSLTCLGVLGSDPTALAEQKGPVPRVTLRAHNNASVPAGVLISAEKDVTRIFAKIEVTAAWLDSPPREHQSVGTGLSFGIFILDRSSGDHISRSKNAMGSTPIGPDGNPGHVAYVFYDRVEDFTRYARVRSVMSDISQVLAFAIAHELGHLLILDQSHSSTGIMRGSWGLDDFARIATGQLDFIPEQARLIRSEAARRSR
jgi:hypothetical protein